MMIGVEEKQLCAGNPNAAGHTDRRTDRRTERRTDGHGDSSIPPLTSLRGYNEVSDINSLLDDWQ